MRDEPFAAAIGSSPVKQEKTESEVIYHEKFRKKIYPSGIFLLFLDFAHYFRKS